MNTQATHWSRISEAGSVNGMRLLFWLHRLLGRALFSATLRPVMLYFMLRRGEARRASLQYLRQVHQQQAAALEQLQKPGYFAVFQHFIQFGEAILDKVLAWSEDIKESNFNVLNRPALDTLLADPRGQLIIGSHFGNIEYSRGFMHRNRDTAVNALVYDQHASRFAEIMEQINPESRINLFQVDELSIPVVLELKRRIDQGEWLVIAGDRVPLSGETRTVEVEFLGRKALLPVGPYILAQSLQCPVHLLFSYRNGSKVDIEFVPFAEQLSLPRKERETRIASYAQQFADLLQQHVLKHPLQWFNFYDFWQAGRSQ